MNGILDLPHDAKPPNLRDHIGYVFYRPQVLRKIHPSAVNLVKRIIDLGLPEIIDSEFVEPEVIEHPYIPWISLISEWSPEMVREAAIFHLNMMLKLRARGFTAYDGHSLNVQWFNGKPIFVDIGSITESADATFWFTEFKEFYITRLNEFTEVPEVKCQSSGAIQDEDIQLMIQTVKDLKFKVPDKGWASYSQTGLDRRELISSLPGDTLIDFGCSHGHYSRQAVGVGKQVVAIDHEPVVIDVMHRSPGVTAFNFDLKDKYGSGHFGDYYKKPLIRPSHLRMKCDSGLAFALSHHLYRAGWSFDEIAERLSAYVRWALIVEFVPGNDQHVKPWGLPPTYNFDEFHRAFSKRWNSIQIIDSSPEPRVLLLMRDKIT